VASTNVDVIVATRAKAALLKIRGDSLDQLLNELANVRSTNWTRAARTAKFLGTNAQAAVPLLAKALQDTNFIVRAGAVERASGREWKVLSDLSRDTTFYK
jgi:HEAT repeat protein